MKKKHRVRWRENGQQREKWFETRAEALAFELTLKRSLTGLSTEDKPQETGLTFGDWVARWRREWEADGKSPGHKVFVDVNLDKRLLPIFGDVALVDLTADHLATFKESLVEGAFGRAGRPLNAQTINKMLGLARQILKSAELRGHLARNPWRAVGDVGETKSPYAYWTPDERTYGIRMIRTIDPEFADLVLVAAHTGLRRGELRALCRRHLNYDRKLVEVSECVDVRTGLRRHRTKGHVEAKYIPMNSLVVDTLADRRLTRPDASVFRPELFVECARRLRLYCRQIALREFAFHDLRHTFGSCLAILGVPIFTIKELMRHETIEMTMRYAHLAPSSLAEAVETLVTAKPSSTVVTRSAWGESSGSVG